MLAATWSAVIWETTGNCYWKARFCETSEPHNDDDDSEVHTYRKMFKRR
jgi:hypothetical protein